MTQGWRGCWLLVWGWSAGGADTARADQSPRPAALKAVRMVPGESGPQRFTLRMPKPAEVESAQGSIVLCHGVVADVWPQGLIPIFTFDQDGVQELRRRPPSGQEAITEPLFFALPPEGEADAPLLSGRWDVVGTHADGHEERFGWEFTLETNRVTGRFDPLTDYRFAYMSDGTFHSNRLTLKVEYIQNRYELTGRLEDGELRGTWVKTDGAEKGTWLAGRDPWHKLVLPLVAPVPLYAWRERDGAPWRYSLEKRSAGNPGEQRVLCRVWPATLKGEENLPGEALK